MAKRVARAAELRQMTPEQLEQAVTDAVKEMFQLRFRSSTERTTTSSQVRDQRRLIARIRTVQREREMKQAAPAAKS